ncbi:hypothetical protein NDS46_26100 [Paenibacillus thiaminolyticus]|uniref:hypothetical protein n=1 Tax=Paenibacillus thiaminolyticus TaxID=49283 RepID=UPI00232E5240|nr:hypothetical protein [Paenibacillus thiaminolyticus]WCF07732.1 hypothetical protein NDS46_26100 [Paenibacillus thiaminolyticus]
MDPIHKIIAELDYGTGYTITCVDSDGQEECYDLWLDKGDTAYCLQTIFMLNGVPDEVGETVRHNKSEITRKLIELSSNDQFFIREMD